MQALPIHLGVGPTRVSIYPNGEYFVVVWRVGKVRKKQGARTLEEAQQTAAEKHAALKESRAEASCIPSGTLMYWQQCVDKLGDVPLHEAVNFYLQHRPAGVWKNHRVGPLFTEYCEYGTVCEETKRYRKAASKLFQNLAGSPFIHEVTPDTIRAVLADMDKQGYADRTKLNIWTTLRAFFNWARDVKKVLPKNIDTACEEVDRPVVATKDPEYYTPNEIAKIFREIPEHWRAGFAIRAFMGVRRAEVLRLDWSTFMNWEEHILLLPSAVTKTKKRRTVEVPQNAMEFLVAGRKAKGPLLPGNGWDSRVFQQARERAGVPAKDNGLRHGFATYHLALHKDLALTSKMAGNSPRILEEHYTGLAGALEAKAYFSITPESLKAHNDNLIPVSKVA